MALYTTPDGRVIVGSGIDNGNDYHGFNGKRDIVIQLTADGATTDGLNALEYLKSYAENAKQENKPIFPDGTRVFISANGYTKAVEADDVVIDGDNITIGGIKWDGSAWDYTNAGQSGGGSGGDGNIFIVNATFDYDAEQEEWSVTLDKTYAEMAAAGEAGKTLLCVAWNVDYATDVKPINYNVYDVSCIVDVINGGGGVIREISWYQDENGDPTIEEVLEWSKGGSGGGVLVVTDTEGTLDKTWQEIHDAILTTGAVLMRDGNANDALVLSCFAGKGDYAVSGHISNWSATYIASSADGYPVLAD